MWYIEIGPVCPGLIVLSPRMLYSPTVVSPIVDELRLSDPVIVELARWDDGTRFWLLGRWDITSGCVLHLLVAGDVEFEALFVQEEYGEGVRELVVGDATQEEEWGAESWVVDPNLFEMKVVTFSSKKGEEFLSLLGTTEKEAIDVRGRFDFDRGVGEGLEDDIVSAF